MAIGILLPRNASPLAHAAQRPRPDTRCRKAWPPWLAGFDPRAAGFLFGLHHPAATIRGSGTLSPFQCSQHNTVHRKLTSAADLGATDLKISKGKCRMRPTNAA